MKKSFIILLLLVCLAWHGQVWATAPQIGADPYLSTMPQESVPDAFPVILDGKEFTVPAVRDSAGNTAFVMDLAGRWRKGTMYGKVWASRNGVKSPTYTQIKLTFYQVTGTTKWKLTVYEFVGGKYIYRQSKTFNP